MPSSIKITAASTLLLLAGFTAFMHLRQSEPITKLVGLEFRDEDVANQRSESWAHGMSYRYLIGPCDAGVVVQQTNADRRDDHFVCASNARIYSLDDRYMGRADTESYVMPTSGQHVTFKTSHSRMAFLAKNAVASGFARDRQ